MNPQPSVISISDGGLSPVEGFQEEDTKMNGGKRMNPELLNAFYILISGSNRIWLHSSFGPGTEFDKPRGIRAAHFAIV